MERRRFLGAAAALAGLLEANRERDGADELLDIDTAQPAPVFEPLLEDVPTHAFVEQSDEHGSIRVSAHPDPRERIAAQVVIEGEWGEAGLGLTAAETRAVGRELRVAAALSEAQQ